jgi:hypothetical protein
MNDDFVQKIADLVWLAVSLWLTLDNTLLFVSQRRNLTLISLSRQMEPGALESEADTTHFCG